VSLADALGAVGITLGPDNVLSDIWQVPVAQVAPVIPYLLLVLILVFRPTGLLGTRDT
jgi:branched-chain amino acid transport system permease protein